MGCGLWKNIKKKTTEGEEDVRLTSRVQVLSSYVFPDMAAVKQKKDVCCLTKMPIRAQMVDNQVLLRCPTRLGEEYLSVSHFHSS